MSSEIDSLVERALAELRRSGILMKADAQRPSVTTMAAGEPIRGSWWGHSKSSVIFQALERLVDHPEVALTKLIDGKDTFVHRSRWPELLAKALQADASSLPPQTRQVLRRVKEAGSLTVEELKIPGLDPKARRDAIRALERRLLIYAREYHTEKGAHSKSLESWEHWARRLKVKPRLTAG